MGLTLSSTLDFIGYISRSLAQRETYLGMFLIGQNPIDATEMRQNVTAMLKDAFAPKDSFALAA